MDKIQLVTLAQILQGTTTPLEKKVVESVLYSAPLFNRLPAKVITGTSYKTKISDSLPLIGPVPYNTGAKSMNSSYRIANAEAYPYQGYVAVDKKLVHGHPELYNSYMAEEMRRGVKGVLAALEFACIYGKQLKEFGMHGLVDLIGDYMTQSADPAHNTNATREESGASVWLLHLEQGEGPTVIWGNKKTIAFGPRQEQMVPQPAADGTHGMMPAYTRDLDFHVGFSQMADDTTARLVNESASHPLTDAMLAQLVSEFPAGREPNLIVMNRHTRSRLRQSRTSQLTFLKKQGSNTNLADLPADHDGIPIVVTDMLLENETPEAIAEVAAMTELRMKKNTNNLKR